MPDDNSTLDPKDPAVAGSSAPNLDSSHSDDDDDQGGGDDNNGSWEGGGAT